MIQYYDYETSPRKLDPRTESKAKSKRLTKQEELDLRKQNRKAQLLESRKNAKHIIEIIVGFVVLLAISYRYALINSKFTAKESLKTELAAIQKQNAQLQVSIEQGMNINTIEQAAKEKLGMQKLDNSQKIYVNLPKKDYTESATTTASAQDSQSWWNKLIETLKGN